MTSDLFGTPLISGLTAQGDAVTIGEQRELIAHIDAAGLAPFRFQQWTGRRLTRSYDWSYDFQISGFERTDPIPAWLHNVRRRAANFANLPVADLAQALVIRYDPGATIGWHRDRPVFEHVVGISLGTSATMRFRRRTDRGFERRNVELLARSIYHLQGEVRHSWEHSIAALDETRWSITFRSLTSGTGAGLP